MKASLLITFYNNLSELDLILNRVMLIGLILKLLLQMMDQKLNQMKFLQNIERMV